MAEANKADERHHHVLPLVLVVIVAMALGACASGWVGRGEGRRRSTTASETPLLLVPLRALIRRHRAVGTHLDGSRCPMFPSCAAYGETALEKRGFLGFLLLLDRLFYREVGALDEKYMVAPRSLSEHRRYFDPLSDSMDGARPSLLREAFHP